MFLEIYERTNFLLFLITTKLNEMSSVKFHKIVITLVTRERQNTLRALLTTHG